MDETPTLDERARDELRREEAEHAERLSLVGAVEPTQRELFEDAEHCRHFERLRRIFAESAKRRAGAG